MNRVRALLISFLGVAVLMAALSYDAALWAQDFAAGFPGGGGRGIGLLNALYCQLASPCVLTGDNASGTGTLRIRPADEDTQIVLCEASNNAATEVCSALQHYNASTTVAGFNFTANGYVDSGFTQQRNNTAFGSVVLNGSSSSTAASNFLVMNAYGTGGAIAGNAGLVVSGAATSTFVTGTLGTVTNDFRGPILNGGSATCNGISAGSICHNDPAVFYDSSSTYSMYLGSSAANSSTQIWEHTQGTAGQATTLFVTGTMAAPTVIGAVGYYGSTYADADYADDISMTGVSKELSFIRTDNPAAGSIHSKWTDDSSASATLAGVTLMSLDGAGNLFLNASATRTKGTITLAAGTGTATVSSGCTPACSDTTAVNAVQCSVSGTTLTANGTGTDVISYHCF